MDPAVASVDLLTIDCDLRETSALHDAMSLDRALATFERTIISARSPYDRFHTGGEKEAISELASGSGETAPVVAEGEKVDGLSSGAPVNRWGRRRRRSENRGRVRQNLDCVRPGAS
jgi:hypothetical protein